MLRFANLFILFALIWSSTSLSQEFTSDLEYIFLSSASSGEILEELSPDVFSEFELTWDTFSLEEHEKLGEMYQRWRELSFVTPFPFAESIEASEDNNGTLGGKELFTREFFKVYKQLQVNNPDKDPNVLEEFKNQESGLHKILDEFELENLAGLEQGEKGWWTSPSWPCENLASDEICADISNVDLERVKARSLNPSEALNVLTYGAFYAVFEGWLQRAKDRAFINLGNLKDGESWDCFVKKEGQTEDDSCSITKEDNNEFKNYNFVSPEITEAQLFGWAVYPFLTPQLKNVPSLTLDELRFAVEKAFAEYQSFNETLSKAELLISFLINTSFSTASPVDIFFDQLKLSDSNAFAFLEDGVFFEQDFLQQTKDQLNALQEDVLSDADLIDIKASIINADALTNWIQEFKQIDQELVSSLTSRLKGDSQFFGPDSFFNTWESCFAAYDISSNFGLFQVTEKVFSESDLELEFEQAREDADDDTKARVNEANEDIRKAIQESIANALGSQYYLKLSPLYSVEDIFSEISDALFSQSAAYQDFIQQNAIESDESINQKSLQSLANNERQALITNITKELGDYNSTYQSIRACVLHNINDSSLANLPVSISYLNLNSLVEGVEAWLKQYHSFHKAIEEKLELAQHLSNTITNPSQATFALVLKQDPYQSRNLFPNAPNESTELAAEGQVDEKTTEGIETVTSCLNEWSNSRAIWLRLYVLYKPFTLEGIKTYQELDLGISFPVLLDDLGGWQWCIVNNEIYGLNKTPEVFGQALHSLGMPSEVFSFGNVSVSEINVLPPVSKEQEVCLELDPNNKGKTLEPEDCSDDKLMVIPAQVNLGSFEVTALLNINIFDKALKFPISFSGQSINSLKKLESLAPVLLLYSLLDASQGKLVLGKDQEVELSLSNFGQNLSLDLDGQAVGFTADLKSSPPNPEASEIIEDVDMNLSIWQGKPILSLQSPLAESSKLNDDAWLEEHAVQWLCHGLGVANNPEQYVDPKIKNPHVASEESPTAPDSECKIISALEPEEESRLLKTLLRQKLNQFLSNALNETSVATGILVTDDAPLLGINHLSLDTTTLWTKNKMYFDAGITLPENLAGIQLSGVSANVKIEVSLEQGNISTRILPIALENNQSLKAQLEDWALNKIQNVNLRSEFERLQEEIGFLKDNGINPLTRYVSVENLSLQGALEDFHLNGNLVVTLPSTSALANQSIAIPFILRHNKSNIDTQQMDFALTRLKEQLIHEFTGSVAEKIDELTAEQLANLREALQRPYSLFGMQFQGQLEDSCNKESCFLSLKAKAFGYELSFHKVSLKKIALSQESPPKLSKPEFDFSESLLKINDSKCESSDFQSAEDNVCKSVLAALVSKQLGMPNTYIAIEGNPEFLVDGIRFRPYLKLVGKQSSQNQSRFSNLISAFQKVPLGEITIGLNKLDWDPSEYQNAWKEGLKKQVIQSLESTLETHFPANCIPLADLGSISKSNFSYSQDPQTQISLIGSLEDTSCTNQQTRSNIGLGFKLELYPEVGFKVNNVNTEVLEQNILNRLENYLGDSDFPVRVCFTPFNTELCQETNTLTEDSVLRMFFVQKLSEEEKKFLNSGIWFEFDNAPNNAGQVPQIASILEGYKNSMRIDEHQFLAALHQLGLPRSFPFELSFAVNLEQYVTLESDPFSLKIEVPFKATLPSLFGFASGQLTFNGVLEVDKDSIEADASSDFREVIDRLVQDIEQKAKQEFNANACSKEATCSFAGFTLSQVQASQEAQWHQGDIELTANLGLPSVTTSEGDTSLGSMRVQMGIKDLTGNTDFFIKPQLANSPALDELETYLDNQLDSLIVNALSFIELTEDQLNKIKAAIESQSYIDNIQLQADPLDEWQLNADLVIDMRTGNSKIDPYLSRPIARLPVSITSNNISLNEDALTQAVKANAAGLTMAYVTDLSNNIKANLKYLDGQSIRLLGLNLAIEIPNKDDCLQAETASSGKFCILNLKGQYEGESLAVNNIKLIDLFVKNTKTDINFENLIPELDFKNARVQWNDISCPDEKGNREGCTAAAEKVSALLANTLGLPTNRIFVSEFRPVVNGLQLKLALDLPENALVTNLPRPMPIGTLLATTGDLQWEESEYLANWQKELKQVVVTGLNTNLQGLSQAIGIKDFGIVQDIKTQASFENEVLLASISGKLVPKTGISAPITLTVLPEVELQNADEILKNLAEELTSDAINDLTTKANQYFNEDGILDFGLSTSGLRLKIITKLEEASCLKDPSDNTSDAVLQISLLESKREIDLGICINGFSINDKNEIVFASSEDEQVWDIAPNLIINREVFMEALHTLGLPRISDIEDSVSDFSDLIKEAKLEKDFSDFYVKLVLPVAVKLPTPLSDLNQEAIELELELSKNGAKANLEQSLAAYVTDLKDGIAKELKGKSYSFSELTLNTIEIDPQFDWLKGDIGFKAKVTLPEILFDGEVFRLADIPVFLKLKDGKFKFGSDLISAEHFQDFSNQIGTYLRKTLNLDDDVALVDRITLVHAALVSPGSDTEDSYLLKGKLKVQLLPSAELKESGIEGLDILDLTATFANLPIDFCFDLLGNSLTECEVISIEDLTENLKDALSTYLNDTAKELVKSGVEELIQSIKDEKFKLWGFDVSIDAQSKIAGIHELCQPEEAADKYLTLSFARPNYTVYLCNASISALDNPIKNVDDLKNTIDFREVRILDKATGGNFQDFDLIQFLENELGIPSRYLSVATCNDPEDSAAISGCRTKEGLVWQLSLVDLPYLGTIPVGELELSLHNTEWTLADFENIIQDALSKLLEEQLAELDLPDLGPFTFCEDVDCKPIEITFNQDLTLKLIGSIAVDASPFISEINLPVKITILPDTNVDIETGDALDQIANDLQTSLGFPGVSLSIAPILTQPFGVHATGQADVFAGFSVPIDLKITTEGVDFGGRVRAPLPFVIPLGPVMVTNPILDFDIEDLEKVIIEGDVVLAEGTQDLVTAKSILTLNLEKQFVDLNGSLQVFRIPMFETEAKLKVKELQANFSAGTAGFLKDILDFQSDLDVDGKEQQIDSKSNLAIFDIELFNSDFLISVPNGIVKGDGKLDLLLAKLQGELHFTEGFSFERAGAGGDFGIGGFTLGGSSINISPAEARLKAEVLEFIKLDVVTPSHTDLTPEYILEIIKSLLSFDVLEAIWEFLKNPKLTFSISPAGSPGSGSMGSGSGKSSNGSPGSSEGSGNGSTGGSNGAADGAASAAAQASGSGQGTAAAAAAQNALAEGGKGSKNLAQQYAKLSEKSLEGAQKDKEAEAQKIEQDNEKTLNEETPTLSGQNKVVPKQLGEYRISFEDNLVYRQRGEDGSTRLYSPSPINKNRHVSVLQGTYFSNGIFPTRETLKNISGTDSCENAIFIMEDANKNLQVLKMYDTADAELFINLDITLETLGFNEKTGLPVQGRLLLDDIIFDALVPNDNLIIPSIRGSNLQSIKSATNGSNSFYYVYEAKFAPYESQPVFSVLKDQKASTTGASNCSEILSFEKQFLRVISPEGRTLNIQSDSPFADYINKHKDNKAFLEFLFTSNINYTNSSFKLLWTNSQSTKAIIQLGSRIIRFDGPNTHQITLSKGNEDEFYIFDWTKTDAWFGSDKLCGDNNANETIDVNSFYETLHLNLDKANHAHLGCSKLKGNPTSPYTLVFSKDKVVLNNYATQQYDIQVPTVNAENLYQTLSNKDYLAHYWLHQDYENLGVCNKQTSFVFNSSQSPLEVYNFERSYNDTLFIDYERRNSDTPFIAGVEQDRAFISGGEELLLELLYNAQSKQVFGVSTLQVAVPQNEDDVAFESISTENKLNLRPDEFGDISYFPTLPDVVTDLNDAREACFDNTIGSQNKELSQWQNMLVRTALSSVSPIAGIGLVQDRDANEALDQSANYIIWDDDADRNSDRNLAIPVSSPLVSLAVTVKNERFNDFLLANKGVLHLLWIGLIEECANVESLEGAPDSCPKKHVLFYRENKQDEDELLFASSSDLKAMTSSTLPNKIKIVTGQKDSPWQVGIFNKDDQRWFEKSLVCSKVNYGDSDKKYQDLLSHIKGTSFSKIRFGCLSVIPEGTPQPAVYTLGLNESSITLNQFNVNHPPTMLLNVSNLAQEEVFSQDLSFVMLRWVPLAKDEKCLNNESGIVKHPVFVFQELTQNLISVPIVAAGTLPSMSDGQRIPLMLNLKSLILTIVEQDVAENEPFATSILTDGAVHILSDFLFGALREDAAVGQEIGKQKAGLEFLRFDDSNVGFRYSASQSLYSNFDASSDGCWQPEVESEYDALRIFDISSETLNPRYVDITFSSKSNPEETFLLAHSITTLNNPSLNSFVLNNKQTASLLWIQEKNNEFQYLFNISLGSNEEKLIRFELSESVDIIPQTEVAMLWGNDFAFTPSSNRWLSKILACGNDSSEHLKALYMYAFDSFNPEEHVRFGCTTAFGSAVSSPFQVAFSESNTRITRFIDTKNMNLTSFDVENENLNTLLRDISTKYIFDRYFPYALDNPCQDNSKNHILLTQNSESQLFSHSIIHNDSSEVIDLKLKQLQGATEGQLSQGSEQLLLDFVLAKFTKASPVKVFNSNEYQQLTSNTDPATFYVSIGASKGFQYQASSSIYSREASLNQETCNQGNSQNTVLRLFRENGPVSDKEIGYANLPINESSEELSGAVTALDNAELREFILNKGLNFLWLNNATRPMVNLIFVCRQYTCESNPKVIFKSFSKNNERAEQSSEVDVIIGEDINLKPENPFTSKTNACPGFNEHLNKLFQLVIDLGNGLSEASEIRLGCDSLDLQAYAFLFERTQNSLYAFQTLRGIDQRTYPFAVPEEAVSVIRQTNLSFTLAEEFPFSIENNAYRPVIVLLDRESKKLIAVQMNELDNSPQAQSFDLPISTEWLRIQEANKRSWSEVGLGKKQLLLDILYANLIESKHIYFIEDDRLLEFQEISQHKLLDPLEENGSTYLYAANFPAYNRDSPEDSRSKGYLRILKQVSNDKLELPIHMDDLPQLGSSLSDLRAESRFAFTVIKQKTNQDLQKFLIDHNQRLSLVWLTAKEDGSYDYLFADASSQTDKESKLVSLNSSNLGIYGSSEWPLLITDSLTEELKAKKNEEQWTEEDNPCKTNREQLEQESIQRHAQELKAIFRQLSRDISSLIHTELSDYKIRLGCQLEALDGHGNFFAFSALENNDASAPEILLNRRYIKLENAQAPVKTNLLDPAFSVIFSRYFPKNMGTPCSDDEKQLVILQQHAEEELIASSLEGETLAIQELSLENLKVDGIMTAGSEQVLLDFLLAKITNQSFLGGINSEAPGSIGDLQILIAKTLDAQSEIGFMYETKYKSRYTRQDSIEKTCKTSIYSDDEAGFLRLFRANLEPSENEELDISIPASSPVADILKQLNNEKLYDFVLSKDIYLVAAKEHENTPQLMFVSSHQKNCENNIFLCLIFQTVTKETFEDQKIELVLAEDIDEELLSKPWIKKGTVCPSNQESLCAKLFATLSDSNDQTKFLRLGFDNLQNRSPYAIGIEKANQEQLDLWMLNSTNGKPDVEIEDIPNTTKDELLKEGLSYVFLESYPYQDQDVLEPIFVLANIEDNSLYALRTSKTVRENTTNPIKLNLNPSFISLFEKKKWQLQEGSKQLLLDELYADLLGKELKVVSNNQLEPLSTGSLEDLLAGSDEEGNYFYFTNFAPFDVEESKPSDKSELTPNLSRLRVLQANKNAFVDVAVDNLVDVPDGNDNLAAALVKHRDITAFQNDLIKHKDKLSLVWLNVNNEPSELMFQYKLNDDDDRLISLNLKDKYGELVPGIYPQLIRGKDEAWSSTLDKNEKRYAVKKDDEDVKCFSEDFYQKLHTHLQNSEMDPSKKSILRFGCSQFIDTTESNLVPVSETETMYALLESSDDLVVYEKNFEGIKISGSTGLKDTLGYSYITWTNLPKYNEDETTCSTILMYDEDNTKQLKRLNAQGWQTIVFPLQHIISADQISKSGMQFMIDATINVSLNNPTQVVNSKDGDIIDLKADTEFFFDRTENEDQNYLYTTINNSFTLENAFDKSYSCEILEKPDVQNLKLQDASNPDKHIILPLNDENSLATTVTALLNGELNDYLLEYKDTLNFIWHDPNDTSKLLFVQGPQESEHLLALNVGKNQNDPLSPSLPQLYISEMIREGISAESTSRWIAKTKLCNETQKETQNNFLTALTGDLLNNDNFSAVRLGCHEGSFDENPDKYFAVMQEQNELTIRTDSENTIKITQEVEQLFKQTEHFEAFFWIPEERECLTDNTTPTLLVNSPKEETLTISSTNFTNKSIGLNNTWLNKTEEGSKQVLLDLIYDVATNEQKQISIKTYDDSGKTDEFSSDHIKVGDTYMYQINQPRYTLDEAKSETCNKNLETIEALRLQKLNDNKYLDIPINTDMLSAVAELKNAKFNNYLINQQDSLNLIWLMKAGEVNNKPTYQIMLQDIKQTELLILKLPQDKEELDNSDNSKQHIILSGDFTKAQYETCRWDSKDVITCPTKKINTDDPKFTVYKDIFQNIYSSKPNYIHFEFLGDSINAVTLKKDEKDEKDADIIFFSDQIQSEKQLTKGELIAKMQEAAEASSNISIKTACSNFSSQLEEYEGQEFLQAIFAGDPNNDCPFRPYFVIGVTR